MAHIVLDGVAERCIDLYEGQKEYALDEEDVLYLAGTLFEAGADTTTSTLISLFLACAIDKDLCGKIQSHVDKHTHENQIPTMEEARQIDYVEAVYQELLVRLAHGMQGYTDALFLAYSGGDHPSLQPFRTR